MNVAAAIPIKHRMKRCTTNPRKLYYKSNNHGLQNIKTSKTSQKLMSIKKLQKMMKILRTIAVAYEITRVNQNLGIQVCTSYNPEILIISYHTLNY